MKNLKFLFVILISGVLLNCKKSEDPPKDDNITFYEINKTITVTNSDSISFKNGHLIFKIISDTSCEDTVMLTSSCGMNSCDVFSFIINDSNNKNVLPLNVDQRISNFSNWNYDCKDIYLDEFAGVGDKYIGFRFWYFDFEVGLPPGTVPFRYGWIKINLSLDKKELKIISRAINYTEDNHIQTGQNGHTE